MLYIYAPLAFAVSFVATLLSTPKIASYMRGKGVVGVDVHKPNKPEIPERVGLSMLVGFIASLGLLCLVDTSSASTYLAVMLSILVAAGIGLIDDLKDLKPLHKVVLATLSGLPILALRAYEPRPLIPFVGRVRLTIAYPIAIPFALSVTSNTMNMADPVNGAMSGSASIIITTLVLAYLLAGEPKGVLTGLALLGAVLAFYLYNRYPARVFSGNVGSFAVGAALGSLVVANGLEVVAVVAMLPQVLNSFMILSAVGGLKGKTSISVRPTRLLEDGLIEAVKDARAPLTLVRMILASSPKREAEIAREFLTLTAFSSFLAIITLLLTMEVWA
ncbi:hypothetical protein DRO58_05185 [Candidatus Bathyarchaeota archaeon]|nr:MAG: hypothetical protein DRO58_05185 [Candidatus Bathyarchaeota archaeon]